MKNDNTILLILAGVAVWYFWKQKNKTMPMSKVEAAGLFTKQAVQNSDIIIPDESFAKQYKQDQAKCV
jgi:ABC-type polysaccharide/polyol phosphate export permease